MGHISAEKIAEKYNKNFFQKIKEPEFYKELKELKVPEKKGKEIIII